MSKRISVPEIRINDELIRIVPNSFVYNGGEGEINVSSASAGIGNSESVHAEDAETQIGSCKFSVYLIKDVDSKIRDWKRNVGTNSIKATQPDRQGSPFVRVFPNASLMNSPDRNAAADGVVELEFEGDQMIIQ